MGEGWYYSKLNAVGSSERVSHTNMTMLSAEEEEEWERNCESGDIRVGFETEAMPIEVTIVDVDEVLSHIEQKENMNLQWSRIVCGICVFVGMLCRVDDRWPFEVGS